MSDSDLVKSYRENLQIVLEDAIELANDLQGKTVITADHGELLGDRSYPVPVKDYGHLAGLYVDELVKVPWLILEGEARKEVVAESPDDTAYKETNQDDIENQLEALGYL